MLARVPDASDAAGLDESKLEAVMALAKLGDDAVAAVRARNDAAIALCVVAVAMRQQETGGVSRASTFTPPTLHTRAE